MSSCPLDHETAASAVRNLNNTDVGGRPLRIDLADSDPFLEGKTTVRGELLDGGFPGPSEPRSQWRPPGGRASETEAFLANLPPGIQVPKGSSVLDSISQLLASMAPNQLMEVLAQMKVVCLLDGRCMIKPLMFTQHGRCLLGEHLFPVVYCSSFSS